ncbi:MAG: CotH kinase family protein [Bacteroidales bacterium]|nr:CotH kinase family protein [Bacteroidales bacterium]
MYCANTDWPSNNVCYLRPQNGQGKWRWILYDTDLGFGLDGTGYTQDMFSWLNERSTREGVLVPNTLIIFMELMKTEQFRNEFYTAVIQQMGSVYHPSNVTVLLDSIQAELGGDGISRGKMGHDVRRLEQRN